MHLFAPLSVSDMCRCDLCLTSGFHQIRKSLLGRSEALRPPWLFIVTGTKPRGTAPGTLVTKLGGGERGATYVLSDQALVILHGSV